MEELNGYTPPASLSLSDFQDAIGDAVSPDAEEKIQELRRQMYEMLWRGTISRAEFLSHIPFAVTEKGE